MNRDRKDLLKSFISFLESNNIFKFDVENFESRLRLQKYVYLVKIFGFDLGYIFNLYIYGPYSSELAKDYYSLKNKQSEDLEDEIKERLLPFLDFVRDRDAGWLEVASTMIMLDRGGWTLEGMIERVKELKPYCGEDLIKGVAEELVRLGLLKGRIEIL